MSSPSASSPLLSSPLLLNPVLSTCTRSSQKQYLGVGLSLLSVDPDSMEDELSIRVINSTPHRPSSQLSPPAPSPAPPQHPSPPHHHNSRSSPSVSPSTRARILINTRVVNSMGSLGDPMGGGSQSGPVSMTVSTSGFEGLEVDELDRKQMNRDVEVDAIYPLKIPSKHIFSCQTPTHNPTTPLTYKSYQSLSE